MIRPKPNVYRAGYLPDEDLRMNTKSYTSNAF